jgi:hypothetical protein
MYNALLQMSQRSKVSCSLCPCVAALLVIVLGRLHVPLLDVLPLTLSGALATAIANANILRTPLFKVFQTFSEPVSKALSPQISILPIRVSCSFATYNCMPKAAPKTVNSMVVLLRMTALQAMVSIGTDRWRCSRIGGVLVEGAGKLEVAVSAVGTIDIVNSLTPDILNVDWRC